MKMSVLVSTALLLALSTAASAQNSNKNSKKDANADASGDTPPVKFRTDDGDASLPWYQIQPGVFPPKGSAHYFAGELIQVDHLNRYFVLRNDRTDKQNRSHWDLPVGVHMLPYGSIHYHGSPAALKDIPLGTHLHGWFYIKDPSDKTKPLEGWHRRVSYEADFTRCIRLEDDFTFHARKKQLWRIDAVDLDEMKLTATLTEQGKPAEKPQTFDLLESTCVWKARGIASLKELSKGQMVLFNLSWATLYGPGRITEMWVDDEARQLAASLQLKKHRHHVRERGLPGWVDAVDNKKRIVTITLFGNVTPDLIESIKKGSSAAIAVAEDSLLTYDPVNDRKSGGVLDVKKVTQAFGSSGVQIQVQPSLLLEGYRPKRIVRVYPSGWKVLALPKEEELFGR